MLVVSIRLWRELYRTRVSARVLLVSIRLWREPFERAYATRELDDVQASV